MATITRVFVQSPHSLGELVRHETTTWRVIDIETPPLGPVPPDLTSPDELFKTIATRTLLVLEPADPHDIPPDAAIREIPKPFTSSTATPAALAYLNSERA